MTHSSNHSLHRRHRRSRTRTRFLVALLFMASAAIAWQFARRPSISILSNTPPAASSSEGQEPLSPASYEISFSGESGPRRLVYPYSVIAGGVQSVEELQRAAERDPVVAQQFQGFDYQHARLVRASANEKMYVAYRLGDKVYWTRKKISLRPGETLISDGKMMARTRCGNRVAAARLGPPAILDPLESDFDHPLFANEMVTNEVTPQPAAIPPALASPVPGAANALQPAAHSKRRLLPLFFLPLAGLPAATGHHEPLAVAPEPGTMLLVGSGLVGVYWKARKLRKKR